MLDVLILRYTESVQMDCLALAKKAKCERFIAQPAIQQIMDSVWSGKIYSKKLYVIETACVLNILLTLKINF